MRPAKYLVLFILCCIFLTNAVAQHTGKIPSGVNNLFDDLPIDDPGKNSILHPGEDSSQKIRNNIFVKVSTSSTHCFLGEPILVTYELYSALLSTSTIKASPSFAGFSVYTMDADNEQVRRKEQDGKKYRVFVLQQLQLTPLQEGSIVVDPMSVYNNINYKEDQKAFHYGGTVDSKSIIISVQPLPAAGRPADFPGATGIYTVKTVADTVARAGENNTLHIEISGSGNFASVSMPVFAWPAGTGHFSVNTRQEIDKHSFPQTGKKIFDIPFVAASEGELTIPTMKLDFFDTQQKIYRSVYSLPVHIHVSAPLQHQAPLTQPAIVVKRNISAYYWLLAIPVLLIIGLFTYRKRKNKPDIAGKENMLLRETLPMPPLDIEQQLKALQDAAGTQAYFTLFKKTLTDLLQKKINAPGATEEVMVQQMKAEDPGLALVVQDLFEQCNVLLYAPGETGSGVQKQMEEKLKVLAAKINGPFIKNNL